MVFQVIVVTFLITLLMNKLTKVVTPTYIKFIHFRYILHSNIYIYNGILLWVIEILMGKHLVNK